MEKIKEKTFSITEEHCRTMISGVCKQCGGELTPLETVDNGGNPTYWAACLSCELYCWGVSKEVFEISKTLVDNHGYVHYSYMDSPFNKDDNYKNYWRLSQISGTSYIVQQVLGIQKKLNQGGNDERSVAREDQSGNDSREQKEISEQIKGLIYLNCGHLDSGGYYLDDKKIDEAAKDLFDFFKESLRKKQSRIDELESLLKNRE